MYQTPPRLSNITDDVAQYIAHMYPIVIDGELARHLTHEWTCYEWMNNDVPNVAKLLPPPPFVAPVVSVLASKDHIFQGTVLNGASDRVFVNFDEFLSTNNHECNMYLCQCGIVGDDALLPYLKDDVQPLPSFIESNEVHSINLWMSFGHTSSNLHYDEHQNLLFVVGGTKSVTLFSPEYTRFLCPHDITNMNANHSDLSTAAMRKLDNVPRFQCDISNGECLYIPQGWYHQVDSDGACVMAVNIWWESSSTAMNWPPHMLSYSLRATIVKVLHHHTRVIIESTKVEAVSFFSNDSDLLLHDDDSFIHAWCTVDGSHAAHLLCMMGMYKFKRLAVVLAEHRPTVLREFVTHKLCPIGCVILIDYLERLESEVTTDSMSAFLSVFFSVFDDRSSIVSMLMERQRTLHKTILTQLLGISVVQ